MDELHNGVCGMHCGQRTLAARIIRAGYYWPTVWQDCSEYVKRCKGYQDNGLFNHQPLTELHNIRSPWPFAKWGMDIVGPFPPASGQRRFLIVAIDYFTKWIEAKGKMGWWIVWTTLALQVYPAILNRWNPIQSDVRDGSQDTGRSWRSHSAQTIEWYEDQWRVYENRARLARRTAQEGQNKRRSLQTTDCPTI